MDAGPIPTRQFWLSLYQDNRPSARPFWVPQCLMFDSAISLFLFHRYSTSPVGTPQEIVGTLSFTKLSNPTQVRLSSCRSLFFWKIKLVTIFAPPYCTFPQSKGLVLFQILCLPCDVFCHFSFSTLIAVWQKPPSIPPLTFFSLPEV